MWTFISSMSILSSGRKKKRKKERKRERKERRKEGSQGAIEREGKEESIPGYILVEFQNI